MFRSSRRKRALLAAASVLATADDLDRTRALEQLLAAAAGALEWQPAAVWLKEADHRALASVAQWSNGEASLARS